MKKFLAFALALVMVLGMMTGVAAFAAEEDAGPVYGGSLTMYFNNLNTMYDPSVPDFANYCLWYERLWEIDWANTESTYNVIDTTDIAGQIADSWEWDADAQTLTVTIRDDIYFQTIDEAYDYYGGRQLVAEDIKWSYDRLLGIGSGYDAPVASMMDWPGTLYMVDSIETDGDFTVIFNFNTSSEVAVSDFMIAPASIAGHEWDELTEDQRNDWHYCCGTGPFVISEYDESTTMVLVKNENYYDFDERYPENKLPYLDQVVLVKVDDTATLMSEFIAGQVDFIGNMWSVFSTSEAQQINDALGEDNYHVYNLASSGNAIVMKPTVEPLRSLEVRQALQYAINLDEIATRYYDMEEWKLPSVFSYDTQYCTVESWDADLYESYTTYDPDKAIEMLAEAGYPDGFTFDFTYVESGDTTDLYLLVQQYLAAVGVTINLQPANDHAVYVNTTTDPEGTVCGVLSLASSSVGMSKQVYLPGGMEYLMSGSEELDAALTEMFAAVDSAQTLDDQVAALRAIDQYVAEQHLGLCVGPVQNLNYFGSSKIGGYDGENMYNSFNCSSILARVWSVTGE